MDNWADVAAAQALDTGGGDEKTLARFFLKPVLDEAATKEQNKPVYRNREFVSILPPGSGGELVFLANSQHKRRFPKAYDWFQRQSDEIRDGMPIDRWNLIDAVMAAELKHVGIATVERLAEIDPKEHPAMKSEQIALVGLAQDYLKGQDEKDKEIEALKAQLQNADKPRRGRPPRVEPENLAQAS